MTQEYTHQKKQYKAKCLQWDGVNTDMVVHLLGKHYCEAHTYGDKLMLRWKDNTHSPTIEMMSQGDWLRLGENGSLKVMADSEFKLKYEVIK